MPYIIEKGYITVDGASLTVTEVDDKEAKFGIMLISHSQSVLTLTKKDVSDVVSRFYSSLSSILSFSMFRKMGEIQ
jgi:riboflavin synthase